ncbi:coiled-coil domain-containing protein 181 isoform X1 [Fundulus heteroclitus]|uniref:coiled-coil domain-containing protein 181 isoform X1 n=2 Tax=Fundulus heteroclitus TaxID=8078 RepID=UPI00165BE72F|nr:coiled-coil domain-containing protein 181 isoform X1 [Fundulus heteroclitus]
MMMTEVVSTKSQEEYEDDFEKDLDWLIGEEGHSEEQGSDYEDIDAEIEKELGEEKKWEEGDRNKHRGQKPEHVEEEEERWPPPMEPLECDIDQESPSKSSPAVPPPPETDEQTDEEKKYILEKIQQANKELQEQEPPDTTRQRRLHFKETLVDLVVPPLDFQAHNTEADGGESGRDGAKAADADTEVSGKMSQLKLSPRNESKGLRGPSSEGPQEAKESKVLVEKDGKFDLVSMKDVESQSVLPPIANHLGNSAQSSPRVHQRVRKTSGSSSSWPQLRVGSASFHMGVGQLQAPRPPAQPRVRPSSASHSQRAGQSRNSKRRAQSAAGAPCQATYSLSPQQKELLQRMQERKERLAREAEQRKHEEEELKRQENEQAFKAWLMKKREQLHEERRIQRAQEIERMNTKVGSTNLPNTNPLRDSCDPGEAFRSWLQRKQEQQQRERQLVELRKLEEDTSYLLHSREECERAFKLWLKRKRAEKRAEQLAAREHSRRLVLEERRARRMRDLMYTVNETKPFRFTEQVPYHF